MARPVRASSLWLLCAMLLLHAVAAGADDGTAVGGDTMLYSDTDNVQVWTSQVVVTQALDDDGGTASASGVVDVVTAASVDVVSHATQRFDEVRWEANLAGSRRIGDALPGLHYRISREPDYDSQSFGGGVEARLAGPDTVGRLDYTLTLDTVGRTDTSEAVFSKQLASHAAEIGVTQNLDARTVLRGVYTLTLQRGYMAKPYRFVPIFTRADLQSAQADGVRLGLESFGRYHSAGRPAESVPDQRVRHALGLRLLRYIESIDGSVRADYRFYLDDWLVQAHTLEASLTQPFGSHLTLDLFTRGYFQTGASFWQRAYVVDEPQTLPRYRSLDRKLSPYWSATAGGRIEFATDTIATYVELSAMSTHFMEYLLLDNRIALLSQLGVEWTP